MISLPSTRRRRRATRTRETAVVLTFANVCQYFLCAIRGNTMLRRRKVTVLSYLEDWIVPANPLLMTSCYPDRLCPSPSSDA